MRTLATGFVIAAIAAAPGFAQSVISAHSGVIHYTEGKVLLNGAAVEPKNGEFPEMRENGILTTEEGRAEILLTPGIFLRVGENASIKMISNHLSDTRVEVLSGEAIVECDELLKDNAVTMVYQKSNVTIVKHGLYRVDAPPGRLRVYDGEAVVTNGAGQLTAKKGQEVMLGSGVLMASKFDTKVGDELMRWAARRSGYLSVANVAAARSAAYYGSSYTGSWGFNPYFGMYTFIPGAGVSFSPFGFPFWSPYYAFMYAPYWGGYYGNYFNTGYYGGYSGPTSTASSYHPAARWNGTYSASGSARATTGPGGGRSYGGGGGRGFDGGSSGGYSGGSSAISAGGGLSGGRAGGGVPSGGFSAGGGHR